MKAKIKWQDGVSFSGETESGHTLIMDGAPEAGGRNLGPRPMEMILLGLGGCTAFDVVMILQKGRHQVTDCLIEIDAKRAIAEPRVYTQLHLHFIETGKNLAPHHVGRAIDLSAEKYCSASIMLKSTANITHDFEIIEI